MIFIEKLDWDSQFFKLKIGRCTINQNDKYCLNQFRYISQEYDLVYIFSQLNNLDFKLMDKKVVYINEDISGFLSINKDANVNKIEYYQHNRKNYDDILDLTLQSGEYSRFNIDENFRNNEYSKLYKEWIDNSINKKLAQEIIVKYLDNKVVGFATLSKKDDQLADISLVAVDKNYRGKGIAKEIILNTIIEAKKRGFNKIQVVTQVDNLPANGLYLATGFKEKSLTNIYHHWNHDTI
ncbi:GNAT family N-acetyltransferase [Flavobacterium frigoris]|nr:GNAT family N-acetyltransferase [Flavobacterium frigoris]